MPNYSEQPRIGLSITEVAVALGIGERHAANLLKQGKLPRPVRLTGKVMRWSEDDLRSWMLHGAPTVDEWERIRADGGAA